MITSLGSSFRSVEHPDFRRFCRVLNPDAVNFLPGRTKLASLVDKRCAHQKNIIRAELQHVPRVSLAVDCWSSTNHHSFLGVIAYYIDDEWHLREHLLACKPLSGAHSGSALARSLFEVLEDYKITDRLLTITSDNAKNNYKMMEELSVLLQQTGHPWDHQKSHIPCIAHVIQLVVHAMVRELNVQLDTHISDDVFQTSGRAARFKALGRETSLNASLKKVNGPQCLIGFSDGLFRFASSHTPSPVPRNATRLSSTSSVTVVLLDQ